MMKHKDHTVIEAGPFITASERTAQKMYRAIKNKPEKEAVKLLARWIRMASTDTARIVLTPSQN
jgi:hypothetical protein